MHVTVVALLARIAVLAWVALMITIGSPYDSSVSIKSAGSTESRLLDSYVVHYLGPLANWDGVYFVHLAEQGYGYEQFHAFFPLLPALMRGVSATALAPLVDAHLLSPRPALILAGVLVNLSAFIASAWLLQRLVARLTRDERLAATAALLWCVTPGGIFLSAIYTESVFAAASFGGMLAIEIAIDNCNSNDSSGDNSTSGATGLLGRTPAAAWLTLAAACFAAAGAARSNGAVLIAYLLYGALATWAPRNAPRNAPHNRNGGVAALAAWCAHFGYAALLCVAVVLPYVGFQWYAHFLYCEAAPAAVRTAYETLAGVRLPHTLAHGLQRPWCKPLGLDTAAAAAADGGVVSSLLSFVRGVARAVQLPPIYGHVQQAYWNVGLFKYYEPKQIPQFLLAAPAITLALWYALSYAFGLASASATAASAQGHGLGHQRLQRFYALLRYTGRLLQRALPLPLPAGATLSASSEPSLPQRGVWSPRLLPYAGHWALLALLGLVLMHVQVTTRFVAACPPLYAYLAHCWIQAEEAEGKRRADSAADSAAETGRGRSSGRGPSSGSTGSSGIISSKLPAAVRVPLWLLTDVRGRIALYCIGYTLVGGMLFSNFYNWT